MCELFAMSSRYPTSVGFSLETLARRGGHDGPHKDGWGVAYFEGHDVFLLRESSPASESGLVKFMERNGPPSKLVLSHIRLATQGEPALRPLGAFNFVYGDGDALFIHAHRRKQDSGDVGPLGLYLLERSSSQQAVDLTQSGVMLAPLPQELALVASVPLTEEPWEPISEGEVIALTQGIVWERMPAVA